MKIGMELNDYSERITPELRTLLSQAGGLEAIQLLAERVDPLPPDVLILRSEISISMVVRAATDRARHLDDPADGHRPMLSDEDFVQNLIDMFLGAFTSPLTAAPADAAAPVPTTAPAQPAQRRTAARR
jgi:hypothetical protein